MGVIIARRIKMDEDLTDGEVLDLVYDWVKKWDGTPYVMHSVPFRTALLELKQILKEHEE